MTPAGSRLGVFRVAMGSKISRADRRRRIHRRIRKKIVGTSERPRLCVFRSLKHTYVQITDDVAGRSLVSVSTLKLDGKKLDNGSNLDAARRVGTAVAEKAKEAGIKTVVFDRNGFLYFGRIEALAKAAREGGLEF